MKRHPDDELWQAEAGRLSAGEEKWLSHHVSDCASCDERLAAIRLARVVLDEARASAPAVQWREVDARLERFVDSQRRGFGRGRAMFALGSLVAAAAVVGLALWWPSEPVSPEPELAPLAALSPSAPVLTSGDVIRTDAAQTREAALADGSVLIADAATVVHVPVAVADAVELDLVQGRISVRASHAARRRFLVRAGAATVRVVGTVFVVERSGEETTVSVSEGAVRVDANRRVWPVTAGQQLFIGPRGVSRSRGGALSESPERVKEAPSMVAPGAGGAVERNGALPRLSPAESAARRAEAPPASSVQVVVEAPASVESEWAPPPSPPAPAAVPAVVVSPAPVSKDVETVFLERVEASIEKGGCERYVLGLEDIANDGPRNERSERARIMLARCFDAQLRPRKALTEFRKYLDEYPEGRFVTEARRAVGE